jgi:hypothetical protein
MGLDLAWHALALAESWPSLVGACGAEQEFCTRIEAKISVHTCLTGFSRVPPVYPGAGLVPRAYPGPQLVVSCLLALC